MLVTKRIIDIVGAIVLLIVTSIPCIIIAIALSIHLKENPFFISRRLGKDEKEFSILKLKTMSSATDSDGILLPDDMRTSRFGDLVRTCSIDELPQLINVLQGDMSLVGPRPLTKEYLEFYTTVQKRRLEVKPGITGWAQINGRNTIDWQEKFERDIYYVDHMTLRLEIKILILTVYKVIIREGVKQDGYVNAERFKG
ncbi:sugar transferase [Brochothrix thermosphacta]|uniref:sugar transferase n=1 Tax=Brochothrix thermosphacta TaxID=2756 RepID=UPI000B182277|nr:sugar transferase [Brochothrix thermosphacta]MDO7863786.1 sugar transferase [Brochothrix thermosphacta]